LALNERINEFENDIALMKLAPELNIVVALGHSLADFEWQ
tara:strand:+ start:346 stop:465 length:120 start_codon:yes stop_codon:yes gene_type:complete